VPVFQHASDRSLQALPLSSWTSVGWRMKLQIVVLKIAES